jgi:hypothetical protein
MSGCVCRRTAGLKSWERRMSRHSLPSFIWQKLRAVTTPSGSVRGRLLRDHTISVGGVQGGWIRDLGAVACCLHRHLASLASPRPKIPLDRYYPAPRLASACFLLPQFELVYSI